MNLVGKIFTVVIFAMSLVFMAFSVIVYATHKNWREVVVNPNTGLDAQLKDKLKKNEDLKAEVARVNLEKEAEKRAAEETYGKLVSERDKLAQQYNDKKIEVDQKEQTIREQTGLVKASHDTLTNTHTELEALRAENIRLLKEREDKVKDIGRLTDELHNKANEWTLANERAKKVSEDLAKALAVLRKFKLKPDPDFYQGVPPAGLKGIILAVQGDFVEISIGEDDGLNQGHALEVYRGTGAASTYVGRIEVTSRIAPDKAVCRILRPFLRKPMERGDYVVAKLD